MDRYMDIFQQYHMVFIGLASILIFKILLILKKKDSYKYKPVKYLNTKSEQNFFNQLLRVIPDRYYLVCKVRLADLCLPRDSKNIAAFNKVAQKHCDFVIVSKKTSEVKCVIELDDKSHLSKGAIKRDGEKTRALNSAEIKLFRIKTTRSYNLSEIKMFLTSSDTIPIHANNEKKPTKTKEKYCPRCQNSEMIKVDMKWPNKGSYFYECENTICRYKTTPTR